MAKPPAHYGKQNVPLLRRNFVRLVGGKREGKVGGGIVQATENDGSEPGVELDRGGRVAWLGKTGTSDRKLRNGPLSLGSLATWKQMLRDRNEL